MQGNYVKETGKTTQIPAIPTEAELRALLEKEEQEEVVEEEEEISQEYSETAPLTQQKVVKKKEVKGIQK